MQAVVQASIAGPAHPSKEWRNIKEAAVAGVAEAGGTVTELVFE